MLPAWLHPLPGWKLPCNPSGAASAAALLRWCSAPPDAPATPHPPCAPGLPAQPPCDPSGAVFGPNPPTHWPYPAAVWLCTPHGGSSCHPPGPVLLSIFVSPMLAPPPAVPMYCRGSASSPLPPSPSTAECPHSGDCWWSPSLLFPLVLRCHRWLSPLSLLPDQGALSFLVYPAPCS